MTAPDLPIYYPPLHLEDIILVGLFVFFAIYKAVRLVKTTRLGWSFATYNVALASLFAVAIFILPLVSLHHHIEDTIMLVMRVLLVAAIIWCVVEVELSRRDMEDFGLQRRGRGQQT